MSEAKIADKQPAVLDLEAGEYWWCRCGCSAAQPWCDGSHEETDFAPMRVEITESKKYALCQCKATEKSPWCDGTHRRL